jgi:hypothetical protein
MSEVKSTVMNLPILKHFDSNEIAQKTSGGFKKGEKGIFTFLKWGAIIGLGYLVWQYVLPPLFLAIGQMLAVVATGAILVAAIILAPVFVKFLRVLSRNMAKAIIRQDPFMELEKQRTLQINNQQKFRQSKGKIDQLQGDMEIESDKSEKEAKGAEEAITRLHAKATKMKVELDEMLKTGPAVKGEDSYVNLNAEWAKVLSEAERMRHRFAQAKDHVQKYGVRAAILKKMSQKLVMVGVAIDNKLADFDLTVEILKKEYAFAQKSREATESAKSAMGFTKTWELEYALDVVTSTIAEDIAITAGNLSDIDRYTSQYAFYSDDLYMNLDTLANKIKVGEESIPMAKDYRNPDYQLTGDDKLKSGGFGNLF